MQGNSSRTTKDDASEATRTPDDEESDETAHIELRGVTKTFDGGDVSACDDVYMSIGRNELVVFLGPSGCGKTTTLRCIAGLQQPDEGEILIRGTDVTGRPPKDRDLAFVFQDVALFPHMTVKENVRFGLDMKTDLSMEAKHERVRDVAKTLGITQLLDRKPGTLSGGQQQRVSLGRAMVMEPAAFLLDEPFSNLDANLRDHMQVEIKKLQREVGRTMIFVTHNQQEAMTLADRIVVLDDGVVQQVASPKELYNDPANRFVANFVGSPSTNMLDCDLCWNGDRAVLDADAFQFGLTPDQSGALDGRDDERLTLAIRPEHVQIGATDPLFRAEIEVIEPQGEREVVHFRTDDGKSVLATTAQGTVDESATKLPIDFARDEVWLFDGAGRRLL